MRHNTEQIKTTPDPPVSCRPRRLRADRFAIAKAKLDAMLRDGTAQRSNDSWWLALHIVPKENGWRPCGDHNSTDAPSRIAIHSGIHDHSHQRAGCTIFSTIDVVRGTTGQRAKNDHYNTILTVRISIHVLRSAQRCTNVTEIHGRNSDGGRFQSQTTHQRRGPDKKRPLGPVKPVNFGL